MKNPGDSERPDESTSVTPPIEFCDDNGFCIVRPLGAEAAMLDSPSNCHLPGAKHRMAKREMFQVEFVAVS